MAKRVLPASELFDLRQALHLATLDALMASRRWEPGDLVFQGGTSLHLAHGSPRFSEDLDFLVRSSLKLHSLADAMQARLDGIGWLPADVRLTVSQAKQAHNPHVFIVKIGGPAVIGAVRVKVELWQAADAAVSGITTTVAPLRLARGLAAGMTTYLPCADLSEIHADKVFALAARPYLKPRDVFDLHWLDGQTGAERQLTAEQMRLRLAIYPNTSAEGWIERAIERRQALRSAGNMVATDLQRWLPSTWPLGAASVDAMLATSIAAIDRGIAVMREIVAGNQKCRGRRR